jgi:drug/metabolite transporter superfamily protein YnfA
MHEIPAMQNEMTTPVDRLLSGGRKRRYWWIAAALLLLGVMVCAGLVWGLTARRVIASSGGIYFVRSVALEVPAFRQADPRWHLDPLGNTTDTMGGEGCAVTSAAMVLKSYGVDTDPQRLNAYLTAHHGYEGNGYLIWEKAAKLGQDVKKAYEDLPSYWRIDHQLMKGNPVIVRIHFPGGGMHFVVIAGKRGFDYLILDPGAGWNKGLYPLREITQKIDGLRYYRRTAIGKMA